MLTLSYSPNLFGATPALTNKRDRARIEYLEEEVIRLRSQLETVLALAVCAGLEIKSLQERLNSKNSRMNKRKVQVNAQYVSSAEATRILDEQDRADAEKRQKDEEALGAFTVAVNAAVAAAVDAD